MAAHPTYNETTLLARLSAKDEAAFTAVYRKYFTHLFLYAREIAGGDQSVAQDAAAEAFIELWKGNRQFANIAHLIGFLRTVAHHKCVDAARSAQKEHNAGSELLYISEQQQESLFFGKIFLGAGILVRIREEVEKMPQHTREVFELAFYERLKNPEIASRLGIADATVRRRKTEALHHLRKTLHGVEWELWSLLLYILYHR